MNNEEATRYLAAKMPELGTQIHGLSRDGNFAGVLQAVVNHQHSLLASHRVAKVTETIRQLWQIYLRGNETVRFLVKNLYLRAQLCLEQRCNRKEWKYIMVRIPAGFGRLTRSLL